MEFNTAWVFEIVDDASNVVLFGSSKINSWII